MGSGHNRHTQRGRHPLISGHRTIHEKYMATTSSQTPSTSLPEQAEADQPKSVDEGHLRIIKKYPNRRMYDTETSSYVTLAEIKALVMAGTPFVVRDAKTQDDLTRSILLQIILEEEAGGSPLFSETVLANLIRFYGHTMQGFFGASLESNIQAFADMQKKMMEMAPGFGGRDAWQKMMHMPMQGMQQMQDQMQRQYQKSLQQWLAAFQPKR